MMGSVLVHSSHVLAHSVFIVDRSYSMSSRDIQPQNTQKYPATRMGATLEALVDHILAKLVDNRVVTYRVSIILFNERAECYINHERLDRELITSKLTKSLRQWQRGSFAPECGTSYSVVSCFVLPLLSFSLAQQGFQEALRAIGRTKKGSKATVFFLTDGARGDRGPLKELILQVKYFRREGA